MPRTSHRYRPRHLVPRKEPWRATARQALLTILGLAAIAVGLTAIVWRVGHEFIPAVPPIPGLWD